MLEDLIPAAVNQALAKAKEVHAEALRELTGGMNLPPLDDLMGKFRQEREQDRESGRVGECQPHRDNSCTRSPDPAPPCRC